MHNIIIIIIMSLYCQGTTLDLEQANRIFNSCDKVGENLSNKKVKNFQNLGVNYQRQSVPDFYILRTFSEWR